MSGGMGADAFVFGSDHGYDTIKDFADGEDLIDLRQLADVTGFDDLRITADGTTTVIDLTEHGGGTIRLDNFAKDDLDAEDFQFYQAADDTGVDAI